MTPPPFDQAVVHRWFGATLNNMLWDWLESNERSADRAGELIHAAHASAYHWRQVGTVANQARSECLVANVYAASGLGDAALRHARRCVALLEATSGAIEDWDRAFALDALARAHAAAGDVDQAQRIRQQARAAGDAIAGAEERQMFDRWFTTGWPAEKA